MLHGKNAIVTGANRGIGKAILALLARHGANLWACARQSSDEFLGHIEALKAETDVEIEPIFFDLSDLDQVKAGAKAILAAKKPVDILINNAGAITTSPFIMATEQKLREMFEVNYLSQIIFTQYIARTMAREKKGSIINISSSAAIEGNEGRLGYASSKAALITATKVMARELGAANIRVNAIAPGLTQTDLMTASTTQDNIDTTIGRTMLKRVGQPDEIAGAALFLASDLSSYMTGQILRVDGGM